MFLHLFLDATVSRTTYQHGWAKAINFMLKMKSNLIFIFHFRIQAEEDVAVSEWHDPKHPRRHRVPRADPLQDNPTSCPRLDRGDHHRTSRAWRSIQSGWLRGWKRGHVSYLAGECGERESFTIDDRDSLRIRCLIWTSALGHGVCVPISNLLSS